MERGFSYQWCLQEGAGQDGPSEGEDKGLFLRAVSTATMHPCRYLGGQTLIPCLLKSMTGFLQTVEGTIERLRNS